ncbi:MAG: flagellar biosynthetic protein FliR [Nitrospirae bacterium]|nr:flagellar biosynthetic protein FliR [Nitrospirota bacterium]
MDTYAHYLPNFLFILLRAGIVLMLVPFFGSASFPPQFRIGVAVAISLVLTPVVEFRLVEASISATVMREVLFGLIFGLVARFIFYAVDMAGQIMSSVTGLSMATAFDPEIGPSTEVSRLYGIIATLIFLAMDAHHDLIAVFVKSYEWLPAGSLNVETLVSLSVSFTSKIFVVALKLSAPIVIIMLVVNILLGFIYKAAPQMNIFFVGQPVYIFIGFLTMLVFLPVFVYLIQGYFGSMKDDIGRVILLMKR